MYIKRIQKTNGKSSKKYYYLHLVESFRTENGPRQKLILNLGNLDIDPSLYQSLATRIEDILTGQKSFFENIDPELDKTANKIARQIFNKRAKESTASANIKVQNVDVNSISASNTRSLGPEYACHSAWNWLDLDTLFNSEGIGKNTLPILKALVISRLIDPGSERYIKSWVENRSSLYELTGHPVRISKDTYYRGTDVLFKLKDELEQHLSVKEKDIFSLRESYYFYDLTNTYFEGNCCGHSKTKYGRSKEKRSDCKLLTMGMIVDEMGFSKYTKIFPGNQSEPDTLSNIIKALDNYSNKNQNKKRTIVMDAGIATQENLDWLKENDYNYITVNRGNVPFEKDFSDMEVIKEDPEKGIHIEIKKIKHGEEVYILCKSELKKKKEEGIRSRIEQLLLERLEYYRSGLTQKGRIKRYHKILESIGRLKEKYPKAAKLYNIEVIPVGDNDDLNKINTFDIRWEKKEEKYDSSLNDEGSYILRTNRQDLSKEEIWNIYIMSKRIESSFRDMKSHLGLRPNFHRDENRIDAHMFISVLAYHILHAIEFKLKKNGDKRSWKTIKNILSTHQRITIGYKNIDENNAQIQNYIRLNSQLTPEQNEIYMNLELSGTPLTSKKINNENL